MSSSTGVVRRGFTLIELLIVVVIIGILAAVAIPKFSSTKGKSYAAAMKSDLRNLALQQENYFYNNGQYTNSLALVSFNGSADVALTITEAFIGGWSATATHPLASPLTCAVFFGGAAAVAPALSEGIVRCE